MTATIREVEYFYTRVEQRQSEAYELLSQLASEEVNLLAFSAVPFGPDHVEFTLFPEDADNLQRAAAKRAWTLTGPQHAFLIQGDDRLGALAGVHRELIDAGVSVYASSGVTDGQGHYGYVIYIREQDYRAAAAVLKSSTL